MTEQRKDVPLHRQRLGELDPVKQKELNERKRKQLTGDMRECFGSKAGRRALRYILNITGYGKSVVGGNPQLGMDVAQGTIYNAARMNVAIEILEFVPVEIQKACVFGQEDELE